MMRRKRVVLRTVGLLVLFLAGCAELEEVARETLGDPERREAVVRGAGSVVGGLLPIGIEEEWAIGGAIATQVVVQFGGIDEDPVLMRYLGLLGRALSNRSERPELEYNFAVLKSEAVNAFAAPGGYVFVTRGLLRKVTSEAELAGVLAHEIAHITEKHILQVIQRSKALSGLSKVTLATLGGDPDRFDAIIGTAMKKLFDEGLDRQKEFDADRKGMALAAHVGYDPEGIVSVLETLRVDRGPDEERSLFRTHPSAEQRLNELQPVLSGLQEPPSGWVRLPDRFREAMEAAGVSGHDEG